MKRAVFGIAALALGLVPVATQAHGPGTNDQPWNSVSPTKDYIHWHCSSQHDAYELFIHIPATNTQVGTGFHSQAPTSTDDIYLILPGPVPSMADPVEVRNHPAAPMNVGGCLN